MSSTSPVEVRAAPLLTADAVMGALQHAAGVPFPPVPYLAGEPYPVPAAHNVDLEQGKFGDN